MPRNEGPGPAGRRRLSWEQLMQAQGKFVWGPGDVRILRPTKARKESRGREPDSSREDNGPQDPGRG